MQPFDAVPADVVASDGRSWPRARVAVVDGVLGIWTERGREAVLEFKAQVAEVAQSPQPRLRPSTITLLDGTTLTVRRTGGCGCGSPLKKLSIRTELAT